MPSDLVDAAVNTIAFALGAALCLLLGAMQYRADRPHRWSGYQLLWLIGSMWTLGRFLRSALELTGIPADTLGLRIGETIAWSGTIVGPLAIGRFAQAQLAAQTRSSSLVMRTAFGAGLINLALFVWAATAHELRIDTSWYPQASFFVALIFGAIAVGISRTRAPRLEAKQSHWWPRSIVLLITVQVLASLLDMQTLIAMPTWILAPLRALTEHWAIPWSILVAVSLAQIHHADIVLKRSLLLIACTTVAALLSVYVLQPRTALACVTYTMGFATLMLVAPHLKHGIDWLLDRVVLKRPDYLAAAHAFEASLRRSNDKHEVTTRLTDAVRETLRLESRADVDPDGSGLNAFMSIPIATQTSTPLHLRISTHSHGRRLMQQELEYLRTITAHASHRLEALELEREQRAVLIREERLKRLLSEAELKALRTQVDPHFLFNTLNTIADLITTQPVQAEQMIERLAECFRYALAKHSLPLSTLDDELNFARHYLSIEQVRFGDRLRVQLSRGNTRGDETVPSLLLQPLLENAIKHGLASLRDGGCVSVQAQRESNHLCLQIEDDGVGLSREPTARGGIGLRNVKQRLEALYSQAATMSVDAGARGHGTTVTIRVPLHEH